MTNHRRLDIQGLRALAVSAVVLFHAGLPIPGGFVGVDAFFVISGYVIAAMLLREFASSGTIDLQRFYFRRFRRLTPALALVVVVFMAASSLLLSPLGSVSQVSVSTAVASVFAFANIVIAVNTGGYFNANAELNPFLHTWSLAVEEQFYFIFPALLLIIVKYAPGGRVLILNLIFAGLAAISFMVSVHRGIE